MDKRNWTSRKVIITRTKEIEVTVKRYSGAAPTLTDPGEPEEIWVDEAICAYSGEVVELDDAEWQLAVSEAQSPRHVDEYEIIEPEDHVEFVTEDIFDETRPF